MYFMPGILSELHPGLGVELGGIELRGKLLVLLHRNSGIVHDPFAEAGDRLSFPLAGGNGIQTPVNEQAELGLAEPSHFGVL